MIPRPSIPYRSIPVLHPFPAIRFPRSSRAFLTTERGASGIKEDTANVDSGLLEGVAGGAGFALFELCEWIFGPRDGVAAEMEDKEDRVVREVHDID